MKHIINIDDRISTKSKSDIIDKPVVIKVRKFDEDAAAAFSTQMEKAHNTGQEIIPVVIDSYGGYVHSLLSMIAEIENAELPVATIAISKAMSCGSVLLTCGNPGLRFAAPHTTVMIHDVSSVALGKTEDMKADVKETERLKKTIFQLMAKNCGHKNTNYFIDQMNDRNNVDWYLTTQQAKKHKVVDHVKMPKFVTDITVNTEFIY